MQVATYYLTPIQPYNWLYNALPKLNGIIIHRRLYIMQVATYYITLARPYNGLSDTPLSFNSVKVYYYLSL